MSQNTSPTSDPLIALNMADAFIFCTQTVVQVTERPLPFELVCALVVNHAFASELYFKCLKLVESKTELHGHDLRNLFAGQSKTSQAKIKGNYAEIQNSDKFCLEQAALIKSQGGDPDDFFDFDRALDASRDAFAETRYIHEKKGLPNYIVAPLPFAIRRVISEIAPALAPPLTKG
jgi:hypothetical protein